MGLIAFKHNELPLVLAASLPRLYKYLPTLQSRDCLASGRRPFPTTVEISRCAASVSGHHLGISRVTRQASCGNRGAIVMVTGA
jgi:hypothetical protein